MSDYRVAIENEYEKVDRLYHNRKKPRKLHFINAIFIILLIVIILLPIEWYWNFILCLPLVIVYGIARLISLN